MVKIGAMRIVAALIDGIIAAVAAAIVQMIVYVVLGRGYVGIVLGRLIGSAVILAYFYLEVLKGQAIGKMIFKYQITDQAGAPASNDALTKRYLMKMSGVIVGALTSFLAFSVILSMLGGLLSLAVGVAVLVMGLMLLRPNCLAYWDEQCGTAVYGPSTAQISIPMPAQSNSAPPQPPPPTA